MKGEQLFELLGELPDDLISEAETDRLAIRKPQILKYTALAACAALAIFAGTLVFSPGNAKTEASPESAGMANDMTAEPESSESAPAESPAEPGESATDGGYGSSTTGFWSPYSLTSTAVTLYTPAETGWAATTVTDARTIDGLYDCLYVSDPSALDAPTGQEVSVLIDLQNGYALTLYADAINEATLYEVPDQAALTEALQTGGDPWQTLVKTDTAVQYQTNLTDYVNSMLPPEFCAYPPNEQQ